MVSVFRRLMMYFMSDRSLADSINSMKLMDVKRNLDALSPARAIKVIELLEEKRQKEVCEWIGFDKIADMLAANPPKVMLEIFNGLNQKLQKCMIQHMEPAKAAELLDQIASAERNFFLLNVEKQAVGNIVASWPLYKQQEVLENLEFLVQMEIIASMEIKAIKKITADWKQQKIEKIFERLSSSKFFEFLETFDRATQSELLNRIASQKIAEVIEGLNPDESVQTLEKLSPPQIAGILNGVSEFSAGIIDSLSFEIQTAVLPILNEKTIAVFLRKYIPEKRVSYLLWLEPDKIKLVLQEFDSDELKDFFKNMSPADFDKFIGLLDEEKREKILQ